MWEQKRNGYLYLCEAVTDPLTGKRRTVSVRIAKDNASGRKEANRRLYEKMEEYKPHRLHLSDLIEMYKKENVRVVRYSTYRRNCNAIDSLLRYVDDVYLDMLTAGLIRRKLIESGKSNVYINEVLKRSKSMLMWGYRNDLIGREIADKLQKLPDPGKKDRIQNKYLEKFELHALLNGMDLERWKLLTEFLALSGLRIGEAAALETTDIEGDYISVTKSYSESFRTVGPTKTRGSNREVFIQPELADVIKKVRICMVKQRMLYGYEDPGHLFVSQEGNRIGYASYNKYLKGIAEKTVPGKTVTPHTLRHTMTSLFAEAGVPLEAISRRLGHESSALTREIYLHITKETKVKDNAEISSVHLLA